jgi:KUP system potassium uptake protein
VNTALPPLHGSPDGADTAARRARRALVLGALGVVYGDIGTSPLYALQFCFSGHHGLPLGETQILGVLSLIVWSLICVVSVQYLAVLLRADNRGEGGIFSLLALVPESSGKHRSRTVVILALAGAALLYGDGVITPAISVLSAVEGLQVATPAASKLVVPLSLAILLGLFLVQARGTGRIGRVFGPVMLLWFLAIGALGLASVLRDPGVLAALNPAYAVSLFRTDPGAAFAALGSVVLCITGAEALYADMGHFGRTAIRRAWYMAVLPALLLSYFGQGAELLRNPASVSSSFFALVPRPLLYPMVGLATLATVIASQALISGAFSLTRQAMQLGYLPRLRVVHTSSAVEGQIFLPVVNTLLMIACLLLVAGFGESERLAAAYGVAVTGAMITTALVFGVVARRRWGWKLPWTLLVVAGFLTFSGSFFAASLLKVLEGGFIPLLLAAGVFVLMDTWKKGRQHLMKRFAERTLTLDAFMKDLIERPLTRVPGASVFMSSSPTMAPVALLHHVRHSRVLHKRVLVLCFVTKDVPAVADSERVELAALGQHVWRATANLGFMESPDVPRILELVAKEGQSFSATSSTFYLSRETLVTSGPAPMPRWRKWLFAFAARNAQTPATFFGLPPGQVVELGAQVDL